MAEQMFGASSSSRRRRRLVQLCLGAGLDSIFFLNVTVVSFVVI
jgi:hypothetical protein